MHRASPTEPRPVVGDLVRATRGSDGACFEAVVEGIDGDMARVFCDQAGGLLSVPLCSLSPLGEEDSVMVAVLASIMGDGDESIFSSPPASLYAGSHAANEYEASESDLEPYLELKRLDDLEGWEVVEGWNLP